MNFLNFIFNSIFKKHAINRDIHIKKAENLKSKDLSPQMKRFSALIIIKNKNFEIFLN